MRSGRRPSSTSLDRDTSPWFSHATALGSHARLEVLDVKKRLVPVNEVGCVDHGDVVSFDAATIEELPIAIALSVDGDDVRLASNDPVRGEATKLWSRPVVSSVNRHRSPGPRRLFANVLPALRLIPATTLADIRIPRKLALAIRPHELDDR